ncbi:MAG: lysophospholipid acyltransferase family protein [Vicingaceae bacterium]
MQLLLNSIIYLISLLPFRLLYILSDLVNFILFDMFRYRRDIIKGNLERSFPEKSWSEIAQIQKKFHRYFCDLTFETFKTLTISEAQVKKRVQYTCSKLFSHYAEKGQSVIIVMGHYGNWELAGASFAVEGIHKLIVIYHPLKNKRSNALVVKMRTRLGNELYAKKEVLRGMLKDRGRLTATAFIADQTPPPEGAYWTQFLNQDTPVFSGTAKLARKFDYPVIYVRVVNEKRGYYTLEAELLCEKPSVLSEAELSELHTRILEADIRKKPEYWLWSHRRWKHRRNEK